MTKLKQIKIEHDESLREIFQGYATLGYSIAFTARCLGISKNYAQDICNFRGYRQFFDARRYVRECKGGPTAETWRGGWTKGKKRKVLCSTINGWSKKQRVQNVNRSKAERDRELDLFYFKKDENAQAD